MPSVIRDTKVRFGTVRLGYMIVNVSLFYLSIVTSQKHCKLINCGSSMFLLVYSENIGTDICYIL